MMDPPLIEFRIRSISLLLGAFQALVLAVLLVAARRNAAANRLLAALLTVMVLRITPYIIGFAGFYDAYPWLTFAPFELSLAFGPLLYLYVRRLTDGPLPPRWALHLAPAAVQLAYYLAAFSLPLQTKWAWNDAVHEPWLVPVETAAALLSFGGYLAASWRRYGAYQRWLDENLSNREELRLGWMRGFLLACGGLLVLWTGFTLTEWFVRRLDYLDRFPFYLALAALVYYLALEGWRHAGLVYPLPTDAPADADLPAQPSADLPARLSAVPTADPPVFVPEPAPVLAAVSFAVADADDDAADAEVGDGLDHADGDARAYAAMAEAWRVRVREAEWWRDEALTLAGLARRLHTSPRTLSRALNEGLGQTFNEFINRMRVEAVARELRDPARRRDLLQAAFDAGFSSKASFNRAFKAYTGLTPSAFRDAPADARLIIRQPAAPAEIATHDAAD
jgi:AraC-like DNA-binding protein